MLDVLKNVPLNTTLFLLFNLLNIFLINKIIINLLELKNVKEFKIFLIQAVVNFICRFLNPILNNISLFFDIIVLKKLMHLKEEKMWIVLIIKFTFTIVSEMISIKTYIPIVPIVEIALLLIMKNKQTKLDIKECMDEKIKRQIGIISLFSIIALLIT